MAGFLSFSPSMTGGTVGLTAAVVMSSGAPSAGSATVSAAHGTNAVRVVNASSLVAFVRICTTSGLTATTSDTPVEPYSGGGGHLFAMPENTTVYVYAIPIATLSANANVYFTPGQGGVY